jgi:hypothetical protein
MGRGDLAFPGGKVLVRKIRGTKLYRSAGPATRFRKAMTISVPKRSPDDPTRAEEDVNGVGDYLLGYGVRSTTSLDLRPTPR